MHPAMPEDIPEPAQEGSVEVTNETLGYLVQRFHDHTEAIPVHRIQVIEGVQREQGHRIVGVESAVTALTERISKLERDNRRLRGTTNVESHRVDRLQRGMSRMQRELRQIRRKMPNTRFGASMTHKEVEELVTRRVAEEMEAHEAAMNLEPLNENGDEQEGGNRGNGNGGNRTEEMGMEKTEMELELGIMIWLPLIFSYILLYSNASCRSFMTLSFATPKGLLWTSSPKSLEAWIYLPSCGKLLLARECTFQDLLKCKSHNFSRTEGDVGLTRWFEKMETVFNISNCPPKTIGVDVAYTMKWVGLMKLMTEVYCPRNEIQKMETELMVSDEEDRVERFIGGLPDNIQGNGYAARSAENKRRMESNPRDNHGQQPPFKRQNVSGQNVARVYTTGNNERKGVGHQNRDCRSAVAVLNTQRASLGNHQGVICYECGRPGHTRGNEATTRAYAIGGGGTNPDSNVVTGTFLLNNCYASMLFDLGADRSFVSSTFSFLLDVAPSTLDTSYAIELADGRISETNVVLRGCTLGLLGHPFDIDLMPIEMGSFDVIIDMDWWAKY
ncbi:putative reverse transcriptase domain-containing protein [Tanacetum coccineum]